MIRLTRQARIRSQLLSAGLAAVIASPAMAVVWDGDAGNGDFNDPINWTDNVVPGTVLVTDPEDAIIGSIDADLVAVVNLDDAVTTSPIGDLRIGNTFLSEGTLNQSAGDLVTADFKWSFIGVDGDGLDPAKGTYNLSGTGTFAQSIADFDENNQFHIGLGGGPKDLGAGDLPNEGLLTVADDAQFTANNFYVGSNDNNKGTVEQSGGTVVAQNWLSIGREGGADGAYNMSGGQLAVTNDGISVGESSGATGSMHLSGDSVVDAGRLRVGRSLVVDETTGAGGSGSLTIAGNQVDVTVGFLDIGSNDGAFTNGEGTLTFEDGASGVSTIEVLNDVTLNDGSIEGFASLLVDLDSAPAGNLELIDVGGILTGTFMGLPEGAAVPNSGGRTITYTGGDGNDIFLLDPNAPGVIGDYNEDGIVNAADYTVWRDSLGQSITLPNEDPGTTPGSVTQEDYTLWASRFGATSSVATGVPEPASLALGVLSLVALAGTTRRR